MASITVGIHPRPTAIRARRFGKGPDAFSTLELSVDQNRVDIYVPDPSTLEALQAALDEIRADMDAAAAEEATAIYAEHDSTPTEVSVGLSVAKAAVA